MLVILVQKLGAGDFGAKAGKTGGFGANAGCWWFWCTSLVLVILVQMLEILVLLVQTLGAGGFGAKAWCW